VQVSLIPLLLRVLIFEVLECLSMQHFGLYSRWLTRISYILDGGFAEVDVLDHTGLTPFYYAYRNQRWDSTVPYLLEKGADIDFSIRQYDESLLSEGVYFITTLYEECVYGRYTEAMKLIRLGADVNRGFFALDKQCRSPLHAVCEPPTHFQEADPHPALSSTQPAIHNTDERREELIKLMLNSGADLEAKTHPERESPLQLAAMHCDLVALQVLLVGGANVQTQE
jgi:ankyrin repeat protein